jgi:uncharacterized damage-inducible protein DinB
MIEMMKELTPYTEWADAVFLNFWEKTSDARGDLELRKRWFHLVTMQTAGLAVLRNQESPPPGPDAPLPEFNELKKRSQENHQLLKEVVSKLQLNDVDRRIHVPWVPEPSFTMTVGELLIQAILHAQHHRGQNIARLRTLGSKPFFIEWIVWLMKGRPAAQWD